MLNLIFSSIFLLFFFSSLYIKLNSSFRCKPKKSKSPSYCIAITSLNEDESIVKETIESWLKVSKNIYLLRDGNSSKDLKDFLKKRGIKLIVNRRDGKAGAINNFVKNFLKEEEKVFFVDVDEKLVDKEKFLSLLKTEGDVVVSKKVFEEKDYIGQLMNLTNNIFTTIQKFSSRKGKALFNGSCAFISSSLLRKVPFRNFKIEDIDFSLNAIEKGYNIIYCDKMVAKGKQPSFISFLRQHERYAYGNGELLRKHFSFIFKDRDIAMILLFLPLLSLFQTLVIIYTIISLDFSVILFEIPLSYVVFILYLEKYNPIIFIFTYMINFLLFPVFRTYNFIIGLVNAKKDFKTTL